MRFVKVKGFPAKLKGRSISSARLLLRSGWKITTKPMYKLKKLNWNFPWLTKNNVSMAKKCYNGGVQMYLDNRIVEPLSLTDSVISRKSTKQIEERGKHV